MQTTWLSLVKSRASIQEPAAVGGWLTTTARREAWKVAKATGRGIPVEDDELARRLPDEDSAEAEVVRRDGDDRLWDAVERLSERCQALLRIVAFEHRPDYTTIAADLGMPVGSIGPPAAAACRSSRSLDRDERGIHDELSLSGRRPAGRRPRLLGVQDPVPDGMVARLQTAAALAASDTDLDMELMLLVERTEELAGARGASTTAYTLRFAHDGVDLLLRVSVDGDASRIDGWVVPPSPITVTVLRDADALATRRGRRHRPLRAPRPAPRDVAAPARAGTTSSTPFVTPAFEI